MSYDINFVEEILPGGQVRWFAEHPLLLGCHAVGGSPDEARERLDVARDAWLKVAAERGLDIPEPREDPIVSWVYAPRTNAVQTSEENTSLAADSQRIKPAA